MERGAPRIWAGGRGVLSEIQLPGCRTAVRHTKVGSPRHLAHVKALRDEAHDRTPAEGAARA